MIRVFARCLIVTLFLLTLMSCVQTQAVDFQNNADGYAAHRKKGSGVVFGQAFLRKRRGGVIDCAGESVLLVPNTGPFKESVAIWRSGIRPVAASGHKVGVFRDRVSEPQFEGVIRTTICDAQGNFRFENLPTVSWIIFTRVTWQSGEYDIENGRDLISEVTPKSGEERRILLTGRI